MSCAGFGFSRVAFTSQVPRHLSMTARDALGIASRPGKDRSSAVVAPPTAQSSETRNRLWITSFVNSIDVSSRDARAPQALVWPRIGTRRAYQAHLHLGT